MRYLLCLLALLAAPLWAQSYPEYNSTEVNDYAGLLSDAAEARVADKLIALREDTGVEMTVLTLSRQDMFAPDQTLEEFATGLFNHWGIGDATRNDGILVMILRSDRAMRIELGAGYGRDWDRAAATVIDRSFIPEFSKDRYEAGIETGVQDVIDTIALPFHSGEDAPKGSGLSAWWLSLLALPFGWIMFGQRIRDRVTRCPNCGRRGLAITRETITSATKTATGLGRRRMICPHCDHDESNDYTISRVSSSSGSSFSGGRSGGGGASGRW